MAIPSKWRENLLKCRTCKRVLITFLSNFFIKNTAYLLHDDQKLIVAGGFEGDIQDTAWYVTRAGTPQPDPTYTNNAKETDTRIWRHVRQTNSKYCLVVSPDTDVYMIGLPLDHGENKHIMVQINPYNSKELKYLHMTSFVTALNNDPDLADVKDNVLQTIQTIFVASGCDYTSFFNGFGKTFF